MRIGISGGTFDPIHDGHIKSALEAKQQLCLDKVIFVPCGEPPHKLNRRITPDEDRIEMIKLSSEGIEGFEVSTFETDREEYSFSIDTIKHFKETYPEAELFFIIGSDVVGELCHWRSIEEIYEICSFAVLKRPGCDEEKFYSDIKANTEQGGKMHEVISALVDISSERLRTAIREEGTDCELVKKYLPEKVREYIKEKELYVKELPFDEAFALSDMKKRLKPERFQHCLRVSEEAVRIAKEFGIDEEKCRIAGLFHDCGKEVSMHQLYWLDPKLQDEALPENGGSMKVIHGPAGSLIARKKYGIIDTEILDAIRFHVTGSPDMGPVAQVVFLADYTEPGRDDEALKDIREYFATCPRTEEGLAAAIVKACDSSIAFVKSKNDFLCPATLKTREAFYRKKGDLQ